MVSWSIVNILLLPEVLGMYTEVRILIDATCRHDSLLPSGTLHGEEICLKVVRVYQSKAVEDILKVKKYDSWDDRPC